MPATHKDIAEAVWKVQEAYHDQIVRLDFAVNALMDRADKGRLTVEEVLFLKGEVDMFSWALEVLLKKTVGSGWRWSAPWTDLRELKKRVHILGKRVRIVKRGRYPWN